MPEEEYDKLQDSVLAWKKRNKLGRFDPNKEEKDQMELKRQYDIVEARKIVVGARCRVGASELDRRGTVRYVGEVNEIPNGGVWVGVETDEPTGNFRFPLSSSISSGVVFATWGRKARHPPFFLLEADLGSAAQGGTTDLFRGSPTSSVRPSMGPSFGPIGLGLGISL